MSITTDYIHKAPRLRKFLVRCFSATIFFGLFFMIHLRGQGLVMTIRRIWAIEPPKKNYYEATSELVSITETGLKETSEYSLEEKKEKIQENQSENIK